MQIMAPLDSWEKLGKHLTLNVSNERYKKEVKVSRHVLELYFRYWCWAIPWGVQSHEIYGLSGTLDNELLPFAQFLEPEGYVNLGFKMITLVPIYPELCWAGL